MDTRPTARWWPLPTVVDLPELRPERLSFFEIALGELHQVVQPGALVIAAYGLVQRPPHQLHRVALRRPRRQGMQTDAPRRLLHVFFDAFAQMAAVVVCGKMQLLVAAVRPPELVEELDEKLVVSAFSRDPVEAPRLEVERPADPHLAVGTRGAQGLLFPSAHPAKAHLGVGLQLGLVLEKRPRLLRHLQDILEPGVLLYDLLFGVFLRRDEARPPPAEAQAVQRAAHGLPAQAEEPFPFPEKLHSEQLAAPARAQPAMFDGRVLFEQLLDALVRLLPEQRSRAARRPAVVEGGAPFPDEAGYDRINGGARAEEHASDLGGRASIGGEQRDVHPEPAAGLRFALHLDDEVFAYLRCDGDILHVRPFLRWLDGCGVFTMPQRTAACSIILCFYLGDKASACCHHVWQKGLLKDTVQQWVTSS